MKKILSLFVIVFILLQNISFAEFNIETKLSAQKQESYKKQVDTVYKGFENKISKFNEEKQISNIEKVVGKIEIILKNKLSDKNNFVLSYLNYLLKEKLDFLKNNDESINLGEVLKVEDEKIIKTENKTTIIEEKKTPKIESEIKTCYGDNWIGEEKITLIDGVKQTSPGCKFIKCNDGYDNINGACIKKQVQITCNQNEHIENNTCISNFRSCNIDNGIGEQQYFGNFWTECSFIKCNDGYDNINGACIKKQVQITCNQNEHIENNSCVSNIKSCNIDNGVGEQNWNGSNWGGCVVKICNSGYENKNGVCVKTYQSCNNPIGGTIIHNETANVGTTEQKENNGIFNYQVYQTCNNGKLIDTKLKNKTPISCSYGYKIENNDCIRIVTDTLRYPGCDRDDFKVGPYTIASCNVHRKGGVGVESSFTYIPYAALYDACAIGYRIPTKEEWEEIISIGGWGSDGNAMQKSINLPLAGYKNWYNSMIGDLNEVGYYWTSSPYYGVNSNYYLYIDSEHISSTTYNTSQSISVRCIKN